MPPPAPPTAALFRALAHPLRLALLEDLRGGEKPAGGIRVPPRTSQPVVSQHLAVLREAGLVRVRREGRRRLYSVDGTGIRRVRSWADRCGRFWEGRLARLRAHVESGEGGAP